MKVAAIVAEYNPFHNGHLYQIEQTRQAGATHLIAVMSGNFVQRAEPAIVSKYARAGLAAICGIDLVLELPVQFATGSSERFAEGALSLIAALGCVNTLSFGSECGDVQALRAAADAVADPMIILRTKALYQQGAPYPAARAAAVKERYGDDIAQVLATPNNLLAVEYLKAIRMLGASIEPFTIPRAQVGHDSKTAQGTFASASLIREIYTAGGDIAPYVPRETLSGMEMLRLKNSVSGGLKSIERAVLMTLRGMEQWEFTHLPDCTDGLGNRLFKACRNARSLEEVYEAAKTRRYTMSRVRRAVCCALLDIDMSYFFPVPYARVLAIGRQGRELLNLIRHTTRISLSHSIKALRAMCDNCRLTAEAEIRATDVFNLTLGTIGSAGQDFTQKLYSWSNDEEL